MNKLSREGAWAGADRPTGCPKCGSLSFIRLRNAKGQVLGDNVVCAECKAPYTLEIGEDQDGS